ncbi:DNA endonuclease RBBP8-like [Temnothorax curvispinosus]|uniref:DNA endonuclease RBBP8-like n=2 Tax=Temnothorax curvispinosus TaxID=300111 RepID=A0A6J1Q7M9_9HYME|nr:DNA endonuclease RBBP8-like [Temnothorax curvispinosus]
MLDSRPLRKRFRLAFYPAVKDATVIENSTLVNNNKTDIEDKTFYLPAEQTGNKNEMDNFNLYDIENKPPKKETLLDKFNIWSKRKDISEQRNIRCKAERAKLTGWDCWECREYYNNLSLSKENLQKRKNQCSRHRRKYERPNTPEGFWNPIFPETLSTLTE